jgi:hypothetical protein
MGFLVYLFSIFEKKRQNMTVGGLFVRSAGISAFLSFGVMSLFLGLTDKAHYDLMHAVVRGSISLALGIAWCIEFYYAWKSR